MVKCIYTISLSLPSHTCLEGGPASKSFHSLIFTGSREQEVERNNSRLRGLLSRASTLVLVCTKENRTPGDRGQPPNLPDVACRTQARHCL